METAALKAASESRNKVFVRKVTAVYTPATLEAGVFEDAAAEAGEKDQPADVSPAYLVAICERQQPGDQTGACHSLGTHACMILIPAQVSSDPYRGVLTQCLGIICSRLLPSFFRLQ